MDTELKKTFYFYVKCFFITIYLISHSNCLLYSATDKRKQPTKLIPQPHKKHKTYNFYFTIQQKLEERYHSQDNLQDSYHTAIAAIKNHKTRLSADDSNYYLSYFNFIYAMSLLDENRPLAFECFLKSKQHLTLVNNHYQQRWPQSFSYTKQLTRELTGFDPMSYLQAKYKNLPFLVIKEDNDEHTGNEVENKNRFSKLDFLTRYAFFIEKWPLIMAQFFNQQQYERELSSKFDLGEKLKFLATNHQIGGDTPINKGTTTAIVKSAFYLEKIIELLHNSKNTLKAFFAIMRPPGHHACHQECAGFCYVNNIILATKMAQQAGYQNIAIIDIDLHTGDGTLREIKNMPNVFFLNLFCKTQYPYTLDTPYSPTTDEYNDSSHIKNQTLDDKCSWKTGYESSFNDGLSWLASNKKEPFDLILVSAGYDGTTIDRNSGNLGNSGFLLEPKDYKSMIQLIIEQFPTSQLLLITEGGYDPQSFANCVYETINGLY